MRIAHIITRMIIGGAQENTLLNCLDLIEHYGDDVMLITGPALGPEGDLLQRSGFETGSAAVRCQSGSTTSVGGVVTLARIALDSGHASARRLIPFRATISRRRQPNPDWSNASLNPDSCTGLIAMAAQEAPPITSGLGGIAPKV